MIKANNKSKRFKIKEKLKQLKNMIMMLKILPHLSKKKKKYLMNLWMKGLKK